MKTSFLLSMVLLCLNFTARSQTDSVEINYQNRLNAIFENVDLSQVPSGILYEYGFPFIRLDAFDGQITDSSKANSLVFGLAYASLVSMAVDSTKDLPEPEDYRAVFDTVSPASTIIPIAGLHQVYHYIDTAAVDDSLFVVADSALVDVPDRPRSPYLQKEVFLFAPVELSVTNAALSLYFDSNLFYNNSGKTIDSLHLDVGNGQGYLQVDFDQNIPITFTESGRHNFKVKITYTDASVYYSHFDLLVLESALRSIEDEPDLVHYITPTLPTMGDYGRGGGSINVYLACGHKRIEKPFIWAEAYNPSIGIIQANLTPKDILDRLNHDDSRLDDRTLYQYLTDNNYDIIVLDYQNGTDYLPRTAEFIKEALRWVNLQKHSAGSNAKNIILGQSMGGVATMLALREMENEEEDHECEKFIIFDSPIRGVNIPMSAQASLLDMATVTVKRIFVENRYLFEYVGAIEDILNLYYAPATRTMMTEQCQSLKDKGTTDFYIQSEMELYGFDTEHLYESHYNYLHGEMGGMPEDCEVLAMANGSQAPLGAGSGRHNFGAGDLILHANGDNYVVGSIIAGLMANKIEDEGTADLFDSPILGGSFGFLLWAAGTTAEIDIRYYAMENSESFVLYSHESVVNVFLWNVIKHFRTCEIDYGIEADNAPGGFFGIGNQGIFLPDTLPFTDAISEFKLHTWCFTPTGSVLNYYNPETAENWKTNLLRSYTNPEYDITNNLTRGIDNYLANSTEPVFLADPEAVYKNTAHTWFTSEQSEYMLYHLMGSNELDGISLLNYGTTFNYGRAALTPETNFNSSLPIRTSPLLQESLTANNTAFNVNGNAPIGISPSPYAPDVLGNAVSNSHFVMTLGPACSPTPKVTLTLESGSEMNIGDGNTRTGSVLVQDGHQITVKTGAVLRIKSGSTLKLNEGGLLYIEDDGTLIIEDGGSLITEEGSEFHFFEGGEIQLNGEDSRLVLGGILKLHEDAIFYPTHTGVNSGIIVINNPEGTIVAETGSKLRIIGDTNTDPLLVINENAKLVAPAELDEFFIGSCQVLFRSEVDYPIQSFTRFVTTSSFYGVQSNLEIAEIHPKIGLFGKSYVTNCSFEDVLMYAEEMVPEDGYFLVLNQSEFDFTYSKDDYQLEMANGNVSMNYCEFNHYTDLATRLNGLTSFSVVSQSDFIAQPFSDGFGLYKIGENELSVKNSTFTGGNVGVYNSQGQLSLRCNSFSTISQMGVFGGYNSRVEMSMGHKQGYNSFDNIYNWNINLNQANFISFSNGFNYFWDNSSIPIINGTLTLDLPGGIVVPGARNQWNVSNSAPSASDIEVYTYGTTDEISYYTNPTQSATCGTYDPSSPPVIAVDSQSGIHLPRLNFAGFTGMRLDSAIAYTVSRTNLWDATKSDIQAISLFHDILTENYSAQHLARPETQYFLDQAYAAMKYTLGHAISDSTLLKSDNTSSFDTTVQKYVDVLNLLTQEDTISLGAYYKRFALELDKANLFRMLGHTDTGLDILQNISLCEIDSSERAALNELMVIYQNEAIKRDIGASAYGIDTIYADVSSYITPSASQATEFYFGSVINSLTSVNYRSCTNGSLMPKDEESNRSSSFTIYPNPSDGIINLKYEIPSESKAELIVYGINGQVIYRTWLNEGENTAIIDLSNVESGLYLYTVLINGAVEHAGRMSIAR